MSSGKVSSESAADAAPLARGLVELASTSALARAMASRVSAKADAERGLAVRRRRRCDAADAGRRRRRAERRGGAHRRRALLGQSRSRSTSTPSTQSAASDATELLEAAPLAARSRRSPGAAGRAACPRRSGRGCPCPPGRRRATPFVVERLDELAEADRLDEVLERERADRRRRRPGTARTSSPTRAAARRRERQPLEVLAVRLDVGRRRAASGSPTGTAASGRGRRRPARRASAASMLASTPQRIDLVRAVVVRERDVGEPGDRRARPARRRSRRRRRRRRAPRAAAARAPAMKRSTTSSGTMPGGDHPAPLADASGRRGRRARRRGRAAPRPGGGRCR